MPESRPAGYRNAVVYDGEVIAITPMGACTVVKAVRRNILGCHKNTSCHRPFEGVGDKFFKIGEHSDKWLDTVVRAIPLPGTIQWTCLI